VRIKEVKFELKDQCTKKFKAKLFFKTNMKLDKPNPYNVSELKRKMKNELHFEDNAEESPEEINRILELIEKYKKEAFIDIDKTTTQNATINSYQFQNSDIAKATVEILKRIKELEMEETSIREQIHSLKRKEMDRIFHEFLRGDYERRYKVKKEMMINTLIGEENTKAELERQRKEKNVLF
jgi:hypothetical protein